MMFRKKVKQETNNQINYLLKKTSTLIKNTKQKEFKGANKTYLVFSNKNSKLTNKPLLIQLIDKKNNSISNLRKLKKTYKVKISGNKLHNITNKSKDQNSSKRVWDVSSEIKFCKKQKKRYNNQAVYNQQLFALIFRR
ncbi:hypothetical protein ABPG72_019871 [Tetrahymena utriculariae]